MLLVKTYLDKSNIEGLGLFAGEDIPAGTIIWRNHPITCQKVSPGILLGMLESLPKIVMDTVLKYSYLKNGNYFILGDNTKFINHSVIPNVTLLDENVEVALRDIKIGEEILENYFANYDAEDSFIGG